MKIIFQLLFTPIILALSIWLFTFIPTPSELLQGTFVLGIVVYPLALAFYVSVLGILGVSTWNFIAFIFREEEDEEKSVAPTASKNKKYNYQPHLKQEIQSLNTVAQITGLAPTRPTSTQKKNDSLLFLTFKLGSLIAGISFALASAVLAYFIYVLMPDNDKIYEREFKAYKTFYEVKDYNDSRIIAYMHALEEASQKLIDSENMYDTFEADTKRQIALMCIAVFRKEHNDTRANREDLQAKNFKLNARNHYATTEEIIKKSIKSEKFLRKTHKITYIPNDGYYLTSPDVGLEDSCKKEISVDVIFKKFMPFYIKGQERKIDDLRIRAITNSSAKKYLKNQKKWVKTLHEKNPELEYE